MQLFSDDKRYHALKFGNSLPDYIIYQPDMTPFQYAFSVCSWIRKLKTSGIPSWLSYEVIGDGRSEILMSDDGFYNHIFGQYEDLTSYFTVTPGTWYHYCKTWSYSSAQQKVYLNGQQIGSTLTTPSGRSLGMNGHLVIGNDQDDFGAGMNDGEAFGGELYKLNFFSKELSSSEVQAMARDKCSGVEETYGDIRSMKWENILLLSRNGDVTEIETGCGPGRFTCKRLMM